MEPCSSLLHSSESESQRAPKGDWVRQRRAVSWSVIAPGARSQEATVRRAESGREPCAQGAGKQQCKRRNGAGEGGLKERKKGGGLEDQKRRWRRPESRTRAHECGRAAAQLALGFLGFRLR
ncbi:hypothetical protein NDU88_002072 [Pleurodeles waltl]|uniref:Uncharacterized protein n=1 Tax=Pleurodeles waltl TaxID=8319 RepID=A0AAV7UVX0_PLEWA|nr:hypothetical protein NDU88_002072 [Pleurodeles waltl]